MTYKQYTDEINMLSKAFHDRLEKPRIEELNQIVETQRDKKRTDITGYFKSLEQWGGNAKNLSADWQIRQKEQQDFLKQKISKIPEWATLKQKDCKDIRKILRLNNKLGPYQLIQPTELYSREYNTEKLIKPVLPPDAKKIITAGDFLKTAKGLNWPPPFKVRVSANNSINGMTTIAERQRTYDFTTDNRTTPHYVYIKWDAFGLYWIFAKPHYNYSSRAKLSIKAEIHIGQFHGGAYFHHYLTHQIFAKEGTDIKQSDWLSGPDYIYWSRQLFPGTPTFAAIIVRFETYSKMDAFAVIDCDGGSIGKDFWYNFNLLII